MARADIVDTPIYAYNFRPILPSASSSPPVMESSQAFHAFGMPNSLVSQLSTSDCTAPYTPRFPLARQRFRGNTTHHFVSNSVHTQKRIRRQLTSSIRHRSRKRKFKTVISYLDIEEAQYNAELEKYMASCGGTDSIHIDPVKMSESGWGKSVSDISEQFSFMSLWMVRDDEDLYARAHRPQTPLAGVDCMVTRTPRGFSKQPGK
ncbi:hypothetical protein B0H19DRAFT_1121927 [Mycena capillaripes]|nr:hypothetical protein B0H19DRAFT_1121927 [Mycena capillaripes]